MSRVALALERALLPLRLIDLASARRLTIEQQTGEVWKAIEDKLNTAAAQRDENLKKMLDRLKEHVSTRARFG